MKRRFRLFTCLGVLCILLTGCNNGGGSTEPPVHEHTWGDPTYTWSSDYSSCTAERVCTEDASHKESETVNSIYSVITDSGCETDGLGRYTVTFTNAAFTTQTHDVIIEASGHDYQFASFAWDTSVAGAYTAQAKYICSHDNSHVAYFNATMTSTITATPTCENTGIRTYTASYDGHTDTKTEVLSSLGHNWASPTYQWSSDYSQCTATRVCQNDNSHVDSETVDSSYAVITPATEEDEGLGRYTATFTKSAFVTQTVDIVLDKLEPSVYHGQTPILSEDGKTITYGLYPQKNVDDSSLVSALDALTTSESNGWYLFEGDYYAKLNATPYDSSYGFDNGTVIARGTTYWFKCEPITWNVLSNNSGEYYILSSVLLDAHCYYNSTSSRTIDGQTVYPNNYKYSDIRAWLNEDFYNSAFALGNSHIQTTTVYNSASTTNSSSNSYACVNTQDKVFLPSYQDYINSSYGFSTSTASTNTRYCKTTDWARARGAYYYTSSIGSPYRYNGYYWTRSPGSGYSDYAWNVYGDGNLNYRNVYVTSLSVRPSLSIKIAQFTR